MLRRSARVTCLVLTLSTLLLGVCPLAPAMTAASPHARQCPSKNMPAGHSCCASGHHQPALVRSGLENLFVISAPWVGTAAAARAANACFLTPLSESPPPGFHSVLRI